MTYGLELQYFWFKTMTYGLELDILLVQDLSLPRTVGLAAHGSWLSAQPTFLHSQF